MNEINLWILFINCRYRGCEPFSLSCPSCSETFECPAIFSSICKSVKEKLTRPQEEESISNFWQRLRCPKCPGEGEVGKLSPAMIANQVFIKWFHLGKYCTSAFDIYKLTVLSLNTIFIDNLLRM